MVQAYGRFSKALLKLSKYRYLCIKITRFVNILSSVFEHLLPSISLTMGGDDLRVDPPRT